MIDVIVRGEELAAQFQKVWKRASPGVRRRLTLRTEWPKAQPKQKQPQTGRLRVVAARPKGLLDESELAKANESPAASQRFLLFGEQGPSARTIPDVLLKLRVRSAERYHLVGPGEQSRLISRLLEGLASNSDDRILDACVEGDRLVVISPRFERLEVPISELPKLKDDPADAADFDVDPDGSFLYWPKHDVHLGWSQFEQIVKPAAKRRAEKRSRQFTKRYGKAVRELRESQRLTQGQIPGLSDRTVRRIEKGMALPTSKAVSKLAKAHKMQPNEYLAQVAVLLDAMRDRVPH